MNTVAIPVNRENEPAETVLVANAITLAPMSSVKTSVAYRWRMWVTGVSLIVGLAVAASGRPMSRMSMPVEWGLELAGWLCFSLGAAIRIWSSSYICARKSRDVVVTGPYSVSRNPLYWGTFLMVFAFPLLVRSPVLAVAMIPPILLYLFAVVPVEESVMANRHGEEYAAYCRKVNRWWPRFRSYEKGEALDGQTIGYRRECGRLFWWLGLALGLDVLFSFENASWWWHPLHWW